MREYPILFNSEMVNAILHGTANTKAKTQTRRIVKPQPQEHFTLQQFYFDRAKYEYTHAYFEDTKENPSSPSYQFIKLLYGYKGDRLWVKETWATLDNGYYVIYKADLEDWSHMDSDPEHKWKPAIHMSRKASRITLEITDIRVERLQDISDADAIAEGVVARNYSAKEGYMELWDSIHGEDAHKLNPFVWVIEFKRLEGI